MIRLKEIQNIVKSFFDSHLQVNQVTQLNSKDFIGLRDKLYTVANFEYLDSSISNKFMNYSFNITLGDLLNEGKTNQNDIYNNLILIAEDFFSHLNSFDNIIFNKQSSIQSFTDGDGDRISGITFRITLGVIRSQNNCITPLTSIS